MGLTPGQGELGNTNKAAHSSTAPIHDTGLFFFLAAAAVEVTPTQRHTR